MTPSGSPRDLTAAAVAYTAEIPVWLVAGVGRVLPGSVWNALAERLLNEAAVETWDADDEIVPMGLVTLVANPFGVEDVDADRRELDGERSRHGLHRGADARADHEPGKRATARRAARQHDRAGAGEVRPGLLEDAQPLAHTRLVDAQLAGGGGGVPAVAHQRGQGCQVFDGQGRRAGHYTPGELVSGFQII